MGGTVHGLHGISEDGSRSVGRLLPRLEQDTWLHRYTTSRFKVLAALQARIPSVRRRIVRQVKPHIHDGDHALAYSNGALLVRELMLAGCRFDRVVIFGGALDWDALWPAWGARRIACIHNPEDRAVLVGSLLINHPWGQLGRRGHRWAGDRHEAGRVINIKARTNGDSFLNHNYFTDDLLDSWVMFCRDFFAGRA